MFKRVLVALILLALPAFAADKKAPKYKVAEPRHFTRSEGVELSPGFPDYLYATLTAVLKRKKLFKEVIGEDEVVDAADAPFSYTIDGDILEYKKGSLTKEVLIGLGTGRRVLRAHVVIRRISNKKAIFDQELQVKSSSRWDEKMLAVFLANKIVDEMKKNLPSA